MVFKIRVSQSQSFSRKIIIINQILLIKSQRFGYDPCGFVGRRIIKKKIASIKKVKLLNLKLRASPAVSKNSQHLKLSFTPKSNFLRFSLKLKGCELQQ